MKTIKLITLAISCFMLSSFSHAQNLQFNSAVFYEYGGIPTFGGTSANIIMTGTLIIQSNQVLKVTSSGSSISNNTNNSIVFAGGYCLINRRVVNAGVVGNEVFLPSGTYEVGFTDINGSEGEVKGYISGILYDIVP